MRRSVGHFVAVIGLLLWVGLPLGILWGSMTYDDSRPLHQSGRALVTVSKQVEATNESVAILAVWSQPQQLFAPAWTGLVERVDATSGQKLTNGMSVAQVDGLRRLVAITSQPFRRAIGDGTVGEDVVLLNGWLSSLRLPHGDGALATEQTIAGIRKLARLVGVTDQAALDKPVFDPAWVIYAPQPLVIGSVELRVGTLAPSQGSPILTALPSLESAYPISSSDATAIANAPQNGAVPAEGATMQTVPPLAIPPGSTLTLPSDSPSALAMDKTGLSLDSPALEVLRARMSVGQKTIEATLEVLQPANARTVPATAVITDSNGQTCVRKANGRILPIELVSASSGTVIFTGEVAVGTRLQALPPRSAGCK